MSRYLLVLGAILLGGCDNADRVAELHLPYCGSLAPGRPGGTWKLYDLSVRGDTAIATLHCDSPVGVTP